MNSLWWQLEFKRRSSSCRFSPSFVCLQTPCNEIPRLRLTSHSRANCAREEDLKRIFYAIMQKKYWLVIAYIHFLSNSRFIHHLQTWFFRFTFYVFVLRLALFAACLRRCSLLSHGLWFIIPFGGKWSRKSTAQKGLKWCWMAYVWMLTSSSMSSGVSFVAHFVHQIRMWMEIIRIWWFQMKSIHAGNHHRISPFFRCLGIDAQHSQPNINTYANPQNFYDVFVFLLNLFLCSFPPRCCEKMRKK